MKNQATLEARASDLERAVRRALDAGYTNADCVLTDEVKDLMVRIRAGALTGPVALQFKAGPSWNFSETSLGECKELHAVWCSFIAAVEDWDARPGHAAFLRWFKGRS